MYARMHAPIVCAVEASGDRTYGFAPLRHTLLAGCSFDSRCSDDLTILHWATFCSSGPENTWPV